MRNFKVEKLEKGECIISREPGNSMTPILQSREPVILEPMTDWNKFKKKDIAYIKIHGNYYTHLVYAVDKDKGLQIGNNHGYVQGWTKKVFAKAHLIPKEWKDKAEEYLKIWLEGRNKMIKYNFNNNIKCEILRNMSYGIVFEPQTQRILLVNDNDIEKEIKLPLLNNEIIYDINKLAILSNQNNKKDIIKIFSDFAQVLDTSSQIGWSLMIILKNPQTNRYETHVNSFNETIGETVFTEGTRLYLMCDEFETSYDIIDFQKAAEIVYKFIEKKYHGYDYIIACTII